jgi:diguanylate cyclase (GGDEF)-like protein
MRTALKRVEQFLTERSKGFVPIAGLLLVLIIGVLDYTTGNDIEIDFFYLLPIYFATWFASTKVGISTVVFATLTWLIAYKLAAGQLSIFRTRDFWNAFIQLAIFLSFVALLSILKGNYRKLEEVANEDSLTGVANRRSFYRVADAELNRSRRFGSVFSIAYLDIDDFKAINDAQGHSAGDRLLCELAGSIRRSIRNVDTLARLGGDEFVILFPETNGEEAKQVLGRIRECLNNFTNDRPWPTTFSVGVVSFTEAPPSMEEMMKIADLAMYAIKSRGKNAVEFGSWPGLDRPAKMN